jgi:hypothetical protein
MAVLWQILLLPAHFGRGTPKQSFSKLVVISYSKGVKPVLGLNDFCKEKAICSGNLKRYFLVSQNGFNIVETVSLISFLSLVVLVIAPKYLF